MILFLRLKQTRLRSGRQKQQEESRKTIHYFAISGLSRINSERVALGDRIEHHFVAILTIISHAFVHQ